MRLTFWRALWLALLLLLLVPALALAAVASPVQPRTLLLPGDQIWAVIVGALVPLATYALNHAGPWLSEPVKALVLAVVAAVAGGVYTALATNVFGWNGPTLQLVLSAVVAAFMAHSLIWLPSGVSVALGGGTNRQARARVAAPPPGV